VRCVFGRGPPVLRVGARRAVNLLLRASALLSRYFEVARTIIGRYGGVVEKFIGDAVMAVWGTPAATEGDAERAIRAALDLVSAVS
jgi:class 3 adenylate cyclase